MWYFCYDWWATTGSIPLTKAHNLHQGLLLVVWVLTNAKHHVYTLSVSHRIVSLPEKNPLCLSDSSLLPPPCFWFCFYFEPPKKKDEEEWSSFYPIIILQKLLDTLEVQKEETTTSSTPSAWTQQQLTYCHLCPVLFIYIGFYWIFFFLNFQNQLEGSCRHHGHVIPKSAGAL